MTTTIARPAPSLGDRFSAWAVAALAALALAAGWALKTSVENRSVSFEAAGITAEVPEGWLRETAIEDDVLTATSPSAEGFGTRYTLSTLPVASDATVADVANLLSLSRGQRLSEYRVLDQTAVTLDGREAFKVTFVFVESDPDVTHDDLPSVVRGVDFIFLDGERAVIATYMADVSVYESDFGRFRRFLSSLNF